MIFAEIKSSLLMSLALYKSTHIQVILPFMPSAKLEKTRTTMTLYIDPGVSSAARTLTDIQTLYIISW
jgi:hypothetical protein